MSSGDPETRERILKETQRLMEKRRGRNVRLEDIAQAAGVSRQAVYMHFGSRSGLLTATARYLDETLGLRERTKLFRTAPSGQHMLDAYVVFWATYIPDIYGLAKALLTAYESDKAAAAAWDDRMQAVYDGCVRVVRRLEEESVLAPEWTVDTAADYMWAALSVEMWEHLTARCGWSNEQYIERTQLALRKVLVKAP